MVTCPRNVQGWAPGPRRRCLGIRDNGRVSEAPQDRPVTRAAQGRAPRAKRPGRREMCPRTPWPGRPRLPGCRSGWRGAPPSGSASGSAAVARDRRAGDPAARRRSDLPGPGRAQGRSHEARPGAVDLRGGAAAELARPLPGHADQAARNPRRRCPRARCTRCWPGSWVRTWRDNFTEFSDTPAAAASIGQVHEAVWKDGRRVAVKIQYPGAGRAPGRRLQPAGPGR